MGGKPDNAMESNRPESGGADKDMQKEKSGLLERDKQRFAQDEHEKRAATQTPDGDNAAALGHEPFSIDNEPNPRPKK